jgi:hypothetical protein
MVCSFKTYQAATATFKNAQSTSLLRIAKQKVTNCNIAIHVCFIANEIYVRRGTKEQVISNRVDWLQQDYAVKA